MNRRRDGERGLTIIEAIVVVTITALLALIIVPMLPRSSARTFSVAERSVDALDEMRAEREFRALVRSVSFRMTPDQQSIAPVSGAGSSVLIYPNLQLPTACAQAGSPAVQLAADRDGLACISDGRRRQLLRWRTGGAAVFAYSGDGASWQSSWNANAVAPYVRVAFYQDGRLRSVWVEHANGSAL